MKYLYIIFVFVICQITLVKAQVFFPINFEDTSVNHELVDFAGNVSFIETDPSDPQNRLVRTTKIAGSQTFAGTIIASQSGFSRRIPFAAGRTQISVRVRSPLANIPIRLRAENIFNPGVNVEVESTITVANEWTIVVFDFANHVTERPALDLTRIYNRLVIFFNFGTQGTGEQYFWDDIEFVGGASLPENSLLLPLDFENNTITKDIVNFNGAISIVTTDPQNSSNTVMRTDNFSNDPVSVSAGSSLRNFTESFPLSPSQTKLAIRVRSPRANVPIRIQLQNRAQPSIAVTTQSHVIQANVFETVVFDFANHVVGNPLDVTRIYDVLTLFFDFGNVGIGPGDFFFWDDISIFEPVPLPVELISFTATRQSTRIALVEWATKSEVNAKYFEVQKSLEGKIWEVIGHVDAMGNSNTVVHYSLIDENFNNQKSFYRLKQVDLDGSFELFNPIFILAERNFSSNINVFPNPAVDRVVVTDYPKGTTAVRVIGVDGKVFKRIESNLDGIIELDVSALPSQLYTLIFYDARAILGSAKFIKQ
ncbi:MAG: hypothetical protein ACXITV_10885 [Luteibaculaceae bacterium]